MATDKPPPILFLSCFCRGVQRPEPVNRPSDSFSSGPTIPTRSSPVLVEKCIISNECQKEKKTFFVWGENKEGDLERIISFDSEMSSVYSENDIGFSDGDTK